MEYGVQKYEFDTEIPYTIACPKSKVTIFIFNNFLMKEVV